MRKTMNAYQDLEGIFRKISVALLRRAIVIVIPSILSFFLFVCLVVPIYPIYIIAGFLFNYDDR